jgi:hypothetical protein
MKPILFNTDMVRAILDGRKSCTRRIVKGFIPNNAVWGYTAFTPKGRISCRGTFADGYGEKFFKPPYQPGDILYIRETWERFECWNCDGDERGNCPKEPKKSVLDDNDISEKCESDDVEKMFHRTCLVFPGLQTLFKSQRR